MPKQAKKATPEVDICTVSLISKGGGKADFFSSKNLRASLFNNNDNLLNEPNFGRIHLPGQYL